MSFGEHPAPDLTDLAQCVRKLTRLKPGERSAWGGNHALDIMICEALGYQATRYGGGVRYRIRRPGERAYWKPPLLTSRLDDAARWLLAEGCTTLPRHPVDCCVPKTARCSDEGEEVMVDLVGTCPKGFWKEWLAEGDAAGAPYTGEEWAWYTNDRKAALIRPGDRFYVVAHGRLRGWAPVTRLVGPGPGHHGWCICRRGNAVACTIEAPIAGFRGLRQRWWSHDLEVPFPDWKTAGIDA